MSTLDEMIKTLLELYTCENCGRCCNHERVTVSPEDRRKNHRLSGAVHSNLMMGYATLRLPCPFISDDAQCTCYSNRPLACKSYPLFEKYPGYVSISQCPYGDKIISDLQEFCKLNGIATEDADARESIMKMDDAYRDMGVGQEESFVAVSMPMPVFNAFYKWVTSCKYSKS
jgi:Fe-S-cluster containining protein